MHSSNKESNLEKVYLEVAELHKQQADAINLTYHKLNWILVSSLVLLAAIYSTGSERVIVVALLSFVVILCLTGFKEHKFKLTVSILGLVRKVGSKYFLRSLILQKHRAYRENVITKKKIDSFLYAAQLFLGIAVLFQFLLVFCT